MPCYTGPEISMANDIPCCCTTTEACEPLDWTKLRSPFPIPTGYSLGRAALGKSDNARYSGSIGELEITATHSNANMRHHPQESKTRWSRFKMTTHLPGTPLTSIGSEARKNEHNPVVFPRNRAEKEPFWMWRKKNGPRHSLWRRLTPLWHSGLTKLVFSAHPSDPIPSRRSQPPAILIPPSLSS